MKVPVLIPRIFDHPHTYLSGKFEKLKPGSIVLVSFGREKEIGVVWDRIEETNKKFHVKTILEKKSVFFNSIIYWLKVMVSTLFKLNILITSSFFKFYAAFLFLFFLIYRRIAIIAAGVTPDTRDAAPIVGGLTLLNFSIISLERLPILL